MFCRFLYKFLYKFANRSGSETNRSRTTEEKKLCDARRSAHARKNVAPPTQHLPGSLHRPTARARRQVQHHLPCEHLMAWSKAMATRRRAAVLRTVGPNLLSRWAHRTMVIRALPKSSISMQKWTVSIYWTDCYYSARRSLVHRALQ